MVFTVLVLLAIVLVAALFIAFVAYQQRAQATADEPPTYGTVPPPVWEDPAP